MSSITRILFLFVIINALVCIYLHHFSNLLHVSKMAAAQRGYTQKCSIHLSAEWRGAVWKCACACVFVCMCVLQEQLWAHCVDCLRTEGSSERHFWDKTRCTFEVFLRSHSVVFVSEQSCTFLCGLKTRFIVMGAKCDGAVCSFSQFRCNKMPKRHPIMMHVSLVLYLSWWRTCL